MWSNSYKQFSVDKHKQIQLPQSLPKQTKLNLKSKQTAQTNNKVHINSIPTPSNHKISKSPVISQPLTYKPRQTPSSLENKSGSRWWSQEGALHKPTQMYTGLGLHWLGQTKGMGWDVVLDTIFLLFWFLFAFYPTECEGVRIVYDQTVTFMTYLKKKSCLLTNPKCLPTMFVNVITNLCKLMLSVVLLLKPNLNHHT